MANDIHHHDESLNPHARGHQEDRIHMGPIGIFTIGLIVVVTVIFVLMAVLMKQFNQVQQRITDDRPVMLSDQDDDLYPGPRLQEMPNRDMESMRRQVNQRLESFGWVDEEEGVAHIPIDRALAIIAEEGLPTRSSESGGSSE